jgi:hypothetical protein
MRVSTHFTKGAVMPFEVFTREFVRTKEPKVTITALGRFSINNSASAFLKHVVPTPDTVLLLWDKVAGQVAIQPAKKGDHRAYPLKTYGPKGRSGTGFSAVTFLNFINYDWSETRSFHAKWADNMLVFTVPKENLKGRPMANLGELMLTGKDRLKKIKEG